MEPTSFNRREMLRLLGTAAGASAIEASAMAQQSAVPATRAVDHLLLGVSDLDKGIAFVEKLTGVKAVVGGSHPGRGTRNALLSLGARQYLEIIAPDPAQSTYASYVDVRTLVEPRLINWAAATDDIERLVKTAGAAGQKTIGPNDGSRATPDGRLLKWKTFAVPNGLAADGIEPIPFFIEWARNSVHPSQDSPKGCELDSLRIEHPNPSGVRDLLSVFGIEGHVTQSSKVRLLASLKTPKGIVELS
jgi:hypothetical protein